ncbi:EAL and GGDEF domain-containing protein [Deinococcus sonorensis]|uniref:EAL domain-containing protein n=2 Tax=Deinococcus sonorensis TaxID=309891 RepID=A0AAU7U6U8_9DEIO
MMPLSFDAPPAELFAPTVRAYCAALPNHHVVLVLRDRQGTRTSTWEAGRRLSGVPSATVPFGREHVSGTVTLSAQPADGTPLAVVAQGLAELLERELGWYAHQAELMASHQQLSAMLQAAPLAVYSVTLGGLIRHWNKAAERTLGYPQADVLGREVPDPQLGAALLSLRRHLDAGQPAPVQHVEQVGKDGQARLLELSAAPYRQGDEVLGLVGVAREVTADEQRLRHAEQQRSLLESVLAFANDSVLITEAEPIDGTGPRILYANEAFTRTTGYTLEEILGRTPRLLQGPRSDRKALDRIRAALKAWQPVEVEVINYRKDGTPFWVELSIAPVADEHGWYTHWISIQRDVTERKTSEVHQERERNAVLELAARNVPLAEVLVRLIASLERAFPGHEVAIILAEAPQPLLYPGTRQHHAPAWAQPAALQALLRSGSASPVALGSADTPQWWGVTGTIQGSQERQRGVIALLSTTGVRLGAEDQARVEAAAQLAGLVIDRYDAQRSLERQALHDSLTGLPNRLHFGQELERRIEQARQGHTQVAVGLMDLDRFKLINDTLGHSAGDLLLQQVAARVHQTLRPGDGLARMGGDEFLLAFTGLTHPGQLEHLADRLISSLEQPFHVNEHEVFVRPSVGFSVFPDAGLTSETLLQQADAAMYRAKRRGGGVSVYTPDPSRGPSVVTLESALNRALEREEFILHYQPQFDVPSGRLRGMEALLRWQHPELGLVPPSDFIPLAEVTGLIVPIGRWVIGEAARQAVAWSRRSPGLTMAVNLSARQFEQPDLIGDLRNILQASGLPAAQLELELTETMLMQAVEATGTLERLKDLGVRLAVDDFGTGYSNLAYLKHFPIDTLKIDQSFIQSLAGAGPNDPRDEALISAVIQLGHALNLKVLAEGVEQPAQLAFLEAQQCDQVQGYLLGRPAPAGSISAWLAAEPSRLADGGRGTPHP